MDSMSQATPPRYRDLSGEYEQESDEVDYREVYDHLRRVEWQEEQATTPPNESGWNEEEKEVEDYGEDLGEDVGYVDAWGDPYLSPSKYRTQMKSDTVSVGIGYDQLLWFSHQVMKPFGVKHIAAIRNTCTALCAVMGFLFFSFCAVFNPFDMWGSSWASVNLFTGAVRIPGMDIAQKYPILFRPWGVKKLQWDGIYALVSFHKGIHVAVNMKKYCCGVIVEDVERKPLTADELAKKHAKKQAAKESKASLEGAGEQTPGSLSPASRKKSATSAATARAESMQKTVQYYMNTLKEYGINVALSFDEICFAVEQVNLNLDGSVTRSDSWWSQSAHIRLIDVGITLSSSVNGGFLSFENLEIRLLEDEFDLYAEREDADDMELDTSDRLANNYNNLSAGGAAAAAADSFFSYSDSKPRERDALDRAQNDISRQLFDTSEAGSQVDRHDGQRTEVLQRLHRDQFSLALQQAPLLNFSSFSCGANVLLELVQLDFSNRQSMMGSYGELKRMYKTGAKSGQSPGRAKKEHNRLRQEMFDQNGTDERGLRARDDLSNYSSRSNFVYQAFGTSILAAATVGAFYFSRAKQK